MRLCQVNPEPLKQGEEKGMLGAPFQLHRHGREWHSVGRKQVQREMESGQILNFSGLLISHRKNCKL